MTITPVYRFHVVYPLADSHPLHCTILLVLLVSEDTKGQEFSLIHYQFMIAYLHPFTAKLFWICKIILDLQKFGFTIKAKGDLFIVPLRKIGINNTVWQEKI